MKGGNGLTEAKRGAAIFPPKYKIDVTDPKNRITLFNEIPSYLDHFSLNHLTEITRHEWQEVKKNAGHVILIYEYFVIPIDNDKVS